MSTTYPIDFVAKSVSNQRLTLSRQQSVTESNSSYQKTVVSNSAQWALSWSWPRMTFAEAENVNAWLLRLKGQVGTFKFYPRQAYRNTMATASLVVPGYAYNDTISVTGWAPNTASGLRAGQYFQVGNQLLAITDAAAGSDANGHVTISFAPELRITYAVGTVLNFANPYGIFRLNSSDGLGFGLDPDRVPDFSTIMATEDCN